MVRAGVVLSIAAGMLAGCGADDESGTDSSPTAASVAVTTERTTATTAPATEATSPATSPAGESGDVTFAVSRERELVTIGNATDAPLDVSGWTVVSEKGDQRYTIPGGTIIDPGEELTIASGGAEGDLKWTDENVWNNDGDPASLLDAAGESVAQH